MGMMLRRHRITNGAGVRKEKPKVEVDLSSLDYIALKKYAKEHGVDTKEYSTKAEMLAQLKG